MQNEPNQCDEKEEGQEIGPKESKLNKALIVVVCFICVTALVAGCVYLNKKSKHYPSVEFIFIK